MVHAKEDCRGRLEILNVFLKNLERKKKFHSLQLDCIRLARKYIVRHMKSSFRINTFILSKET
jgi:hypothetical protein